MGGCTYLRVRSFFFGDFLVFSVPFREQPGQPPHRRAHPGPLGGYRLLLEWVFFRLILILLNPLCFCFFTGETSTSVEFYFTFMQQAQLHAATKWSALEEEHGSHTNPASSSLQFVLLFPSRRVARARLGTHSCAAPREKEECTVDRVCHVSLWAGMCLPDKLSNVTLSMSPTQKKGERPHETRVRRTILTTLNTDTSGNLESVRAPRAARSMSRDCSHTCLCCSRLSNAHQLPPRPPSLW